MVVVVGCGGRSGERVRGEWGRKKKKKRKKERKKYPTQKEKVDRKRKRCEQLIFFLFFKRQQKHTLIIFSNDDENNKIDVLSNTILLPVYIVEVWQGRWYWSHLHVRSNHL